MPTCNNCTQQFTILPEDKEFYQRINVSEPTHCPDCRMRTLMAYRNERHFFSRSCDNCGKKIISIYSEDKKNPVYCTDCWWSDEWNSMDYGREFDFTRPFFEQFQELFDAVPQLHMINALGENTEYSNYCYRCKDCYLLIASDDCENCHFANYMWDSKDCLDCLYVTDSDLCYELIDSHKCYHCRFSQKLDSCADCHFCFDLGGCTNCFGCTGLRHKQNCWFNEQLSPEEYQARLNEVLWKKQNINFYQEELEKAKLELPRKFANLLKCEDCTGDYLKESKSARHCFDSYGAENSKFIINGPGNVNNCYDVCGAKDVELSYLGVSSGGPGINHLCANHAWDGCRDIAYCAFSVASHDIFGCACLRHKQYCILNRQYPEAEYRKLREKIINHIKKTGEYGRFFPLKKSPFKYEETLAAEMYPQGGPSKKESKAKNEKGKNCPECGKEFKIIPQEKRFYEEQKLPEPDKCPDCRHKARLGMRNPYKLWHRQCMREGCENEFETTFSPEKPEIVYCEECYKKEIYG